MQHLEQYYGVPLFTRGKNRIELNDTGRLAVEHARKLLRDAEEAVQQIRAFDRRQLQTLTDLLRRYAGECQYNVGVGHVLGALNAELSDALLR